MTAASLPMAAKQRHYHWWVVGTVCVGAFMAALDSSIVNIALPVLRTEFHTHMRVVEWISLSYVLTLAATIIPLSRLSDMFGRRWMYSVGFLIFIVGSFLCGFADSLSILIVSRILQALGAAMLQANSVSIITSVAPGRTRGKAIGIQASAQGVGLSLGPVIGGTIITFLGWRWIFYVNVPVGIIGTILGILLLPPDIKKSVREKFDFLGALSLAPFLIAIIYVLNSGAETGWVSPIVLLCYGAIAVGFVAFWFIEKWAKHPMVDLNLFRSRTFMYGNITVMLSFTVMYAVMFLAPFYLDNLLKFTTLTSGLFLTAVPIGMTIFTPISGAIADRIGTKLPTVFGMFISVAGCVLLAVSSEWYSAVILITGLLLVGVGMGTFTPPNNSQVMGSVPSNRLGITGGMLNLSRTLGMGLGVTLGGMLYQVFLRSYGAAVENQATTAQMIPSFRDSFMVISILTMVVAGISAIPGPRSSR